MAEADRAPPSPPEVERFVERLRTSLADGSFVRLTLGQPRGGAGTAQRVLARRIVLRGEDQLQFTIRHPTRDVTKNLPAAAAADAVTAWLANEFGHGHLISTGHDVQVAATRRGGWQLRVGRLPAPATAPTAEHDRARRHPLSLATPFLVELGVTDAQQQLIPAMARKWRQIVKFVELVTHAIDGSPLRDARAMRVLDFGAGKGYLTFALHHALVQRGIAARVTGVELRPELAESGNAAAQRLGLAGIDFAAGDIHRWPVEPVDLMIALHACDIATDVAMHRGVRCRAAIIVCSPCCHKQLRPQLRAPAVLEPVLRHGIHRSEFAEMLTDALRALLLEAEGYDARVAEFVSPEHTARNRIVLAVRRATAPAAAERGRILDQVRALKDFFGVRTQYLENLLAADAA